MGKLLQELKRRNVFRVGVAYVVVAWLIIQVVETVSEPLGLPEWTVAFFIVLMLAGFPVILLFSWAFELTPEGLKWVHLSKALVRRTQGDLATALDHLERAAFRSIILVERLEFFIETMGLDEEPQFVALRERHRAYMHDERDKLLAMACGPDGFSVWQPSAEECGQRRAPIGPN